MRTGTSMMMRALEAGGLQAVYDERRNNLNDKFGDKFYKPNDNGFYELSRNQYRKSGFPRMYRGKLIKFLSGGITRIVAGNYLIVFMLRDPEEVRQSYLAFFDKQSPLSCEDYISAMHDVIGILSMRRDILLVALQYRRVISEPLRTFEELKEKGWAINPRDAANVIDPSLCRFKLESLTVGIK